VGNVCGNNLGGVALRRGRRSSSAQARSPFPSLPAQGSASPKARCHIGNLFRGPPQSNSYLKVGFVAHHRRHSGTVRTRTIGDQLLRPHDWERRGAVHIQFAKRICNVRLSATNVSKTDKRKTL